MFSDSVWVFFLPSRGPLVSVDLKHYENQLSETWIWQWHHDDALSLFFGVHFSIWMVWKPLSDLWILLSGVSLFMECINLKAILILADKYTV